jgi:hypothetical protein
MRTEKFGSVFSMKRESYYQNYQFQNQRGGVMLLLGIVIINVRGILYIRVVIIINLLIV